MVYFLWNGAVILFWVGLHGALLMRGWLEFVGRVVCGVVFIVCWYNVSQFVFNIYGWLSVLGLVYLFLVVVVGVVLFGYVVVMVYFVIV